MRVLTALTLCLTILPASALPMEIEWVRMTARHPVETAPVITDVTGDGKPEIVSVNRGGQVMLWGLDSKAIGSGEDGTAAQLPKGEWTTTPTVLRTAAGPRIIFCSTSGSLVALDRNMKTLWTYALPGSTTWGRAIPAVFDTPSGPAACFADNTGTFTCLDADGQVRWQVKTGAGSGQAPLQAAQLGGQTAILGAAGSTLFCLGTDGAVRWRKDLGGKILSRPEVLALPDRRLVLCAAGAGAMIALTETGDVAWRTELGGEVDMSIAFLPRPTGQPLILCTGLWGNLHAIEPDGRLAWTHLYRAKGRGTPLITDTNNDGKPEVLVTTYDQRLYAFSSDGEVVDTVRAGGLINSSPVPIADPAAPGRTDVLVTTAALLAYRFRPGPAVAMHGEPGKPANIGLDTRPATGGEPAALIVRNPNAALIGVNLLAQTAEGRTLVRGFVTSRTAFEVATPGGATKCKAIVRLGAETLRELTWSPTEAAAPDDGRDIRVWATPAYGLFSPQRLAPVPAELAAGDGREIALPHLYRNEDGQGAFIVASCAGSLRSLRVRVDQPARADGKPFTGRVALRRVELVPTINGEMAADALPSLGDGGALNLAPGEAVKLWLSVQPNGCEPGTYHGAVRVEGTEAAVQPQTLALRIEVLPLSLPKRALTLCTWDYVPNKWFPSWTSDTLDDMGRHGVNVFPRASCSPPAAADAHGRLTIDWTTLDAELDRLKGRGEILIQLFWPDVKFAAEPSATTRRKAEVAYVLAMRDHLRSRGLRYSDWAFYPVDEPGLHPETAGNLIKAATLFREADPRIRIYTDPVPTLPWADFERIEKLIDVWCPNMRLVSGLVARDPRAERIMKSGKPIWSYECVGQVKSLSPVRYNRANAWRATRFGLDGIGFWTHSQTQADPWLRNEKAGDEYALVYPGDRPVPSVRWEAARDGLQDVAALALLKQRIAKHRRSAAKRAQVAEARTLIARALADVAHLSDDTFIESRDFLAQGDRMIWHTWTDAAQFEHYRARIAELTLALGD